MKELEFTVGLMAKLNRVAEPIQLRVRPFSFLTERGQRSAEARLVVGFRQFPFALGNVKAVFVQVGARWLRAWSFAVQHGPRGHEYTILASASQGNERITKEAALKELSGRRRRR